MRRVQKQLLALTASCALLGVACENTSRGVQQDAAQASAETKEAGREVRAEGREAAADARAAGREVAAETREATREVGAEAREAGREVRAEGREAREEARENTAGARAEVREAGRETRDAAGNAGRAIAAAGETMDVKAALMADDMVDASNINVDTVHQTKTVVLKGSVRTAAQKTAAGRIAAREAEGYKVDNQLMVK